jgi:serine/threonine protein kinase
MVFEKMDCSLKRLLELRGALSIPEAKFILWSIVRALQEIHSRGLIHRNIKTTEVLINLGDNPQVKLTDFSQQYDKLGIAYWLCRPTYPFTIEICEPEILLGGTKYDYTTDAW